MTRRTLEIAAFCAALLIAALAIHAWLSSRDEQQRLQATLAAQKQILDAADAREQTRQATLNDTLAKIEKLRRATQTPQQILRDLPNYLSLPEPITLVPATTQISGSASPAERPAAPGRPSSITSAQQGTTLPAKSAPATNSNASCGNISVGALPCPEQRPRSVAPPVAGPDVEGLPGRRSVEPGTSEQAEGPERHDRPRVPSGTVENSMPQRAESESHPGASQSQQPTPSAVPCSGAANCVAQIPSTDLKPLYDFAQNCRECQLRLTATQQDHADDLTKLAALARERDAAVTAAKGGNFWRRLRRNTVWFIVGAAVGAAAAHATVSH
jgi:type II secretory pathway pseudopilin PulG